MMQKLGRNDPCHCDSGQKYKRCCLPHGILPPAKNISTISVVAQQESQKKLLKRAQRRMKNFTVSDSGSSLKMSAIILELADFLLKATRTKQEENDAISITCLAWNMAVLDPVQSQKWYDSFFSNENDDPVFQEDIAHIIKTIIAKKNHLYPEINRIILDYELLQNTKNRHLTIMSTVQEKEVIEGKLLV